MRTFEDLGVRQLDEALKPFGPLKQRPPPRQGWARTLREALGMSLRQLADRAGLSTTAVRSVEINEARRKVQLRSLEALADAMDCDLVYALIPRSSLQSSLERQAGRVADRMMERVSGSMALEAQGVAPEVVSLQWEALKQEVLRQRGRDFWDV